MAFLDELRDRAADAMQVTGKKVEEVYGTTKVKLQIADKQSAVRTLYRELGEIVYENSKKDEPDFDAVEDKIAEIDLAFDAIEELKASERKIKNTVKCPACGEDVDKEANFCSKCGCEMSAE